MAVTASLSSLHFPSLTTPSPTRAIYYSYINKPIRPIYPSTHHFSFRHRTINAIEERARENVNEIIEEVEEEKTVEPSSSSPPPPEVQESKKSDDLWSGVAEEIKEIEWPGFNKVLGITGVVLGVIAGSSVVLLTVNAILAELSDRVFVGRGVQDFFG
ncbi:hypothetical protein IFM89_018991 [Coptis chinensis]|uniref:Preprotein translocase subunit SECE1 n=1 Tax=Coptis chinensis TaxID=261450 RepID=A0A835IB06_9MAGN|nr:hypothetical protein IFM89_018991 [Coptis chinensis]